MIDYETIARNNHDKFQHLKCSELRGILRGKCNDYVGVAASIVAQMGILHE